MPLIGFAGAPLTLAAYLVQGGGSANYLEFRTWLVRNPELARELLDKLTEVGIRCCGCRSRRAPWRSSSSTVGASHLYPQLAKLPAEVVSVDWRYRLSRCRLAMPGKVIQGNLDPTVLLADDDVVDATALQLLRDGLGGAHIFNLGHGVLPTTPPDTVARLVDTVHRFSRPTGAVTGRTAGHGWRCTGRPSSTRATCPRSWPTSRLATTSVCTGSCAPTSGTCCPTASRARRQVREEVPFYTGRRRSIGEILATLP